MITIDKNNLVSLIKTMQGIVPANYPSMDRLVSCVQYLEALLGTAEEGTEEVTSDG